MTKHRAPEERVAEILQAAAEVVEESGHASLTMDAIARRTTLSKAGVYRFFPNKTAVVHALFRWLFERMTEFDSDEALAWGLPANETVSRMLTEQHAHPDAAWLHRVWLQLLPATLHDPELAAIRRSVLAETTAQFRDVALQVLARDGEPPPDDFDRRFAEAALLTHCLLEGMAIEGSTTESDDGEALAALNPYIHKFMEMLNHELFPSEDNG